MSVGTSGRRRRETSRTRTPELSELDLRILALLSRHRVVTQTQLAAICPEVPVRTLRYRCARLGARGLLGRTRPYRERGSAPNHLWPTRRGEATACGGPPPRGGERREPNPLFLAHAAGLTDLYVELESGLPEGARLTRFEREAEAREPFTVAEPAGRRKRRERAIAPDALVEVTGPGGRSLLAFVELDMGTMSHRRLGQKASGYAAYAEAQAWEERHPFCPALLFLTTTEGRARSFLAAVHREAGKDSLLLTCACELARSPVGIAERPVWLQDPDREGAFDLIIVLEEARRPFDEARKREDAGRRTEEAEREQLRTEPEALREHLRRWWGSEPRLRYLDEPHAGALAITLAGTDPLADSERRALLTLATMLDDPLRPRAPEEESTARQKRAFEDLVEHHRDKQLRRITALAGRHGDGPAIRRARRKVSSGQLLSLADLAGLDLAAVADGRSRKEQERLADTYDRWREEEARRLVKGQGLVARLGSSPEDFLDEVDRRSLRFCRHCAEIAHPDPGRVAGMHPAADVASRCHFCGGTTLARIDGDGQP